MRISKTVLILSAVATVLLTIFMFYSINAVITSYRAELKEKHVERHTKKESLFDHFFNKLQKLK